MTKHLTIAIGSLFSMIGLGTVVFHSLEDWTWIQSFYFSVVTLTTVGYGDLAPTSDESRLAAALFILVGVAIVITSLSVIGNSYLNRRVHGRKKKG